MRRAIMREYWMNVSWQSTVSSQQSVVWQLAIILGFCQSDGSRALDTVSPTRGLPRVSALGSGLRASWPCSLPAAQLLAVLHNQRPTHRDRNKSHADWTQIPSVRLSDQVRPAEKLTREQKGARVEVIPITTFGNERFSNRISNKLIEYRWKR